jgi:nucleoside-diphosphate kinase
MMIKPDALRAGAAGKIIARVEDAGFTLRAMQMVRLTKEQAGAFYREHAERPFYGELVAFMSSGPIIALLLEKAQAVADLRTLVGATDSREAESGTIRRDFGTNNQQNAVHASDSPESAQREAAFFFSERDRHSI